MACALKPGIAVAAVLWLDRTGFLSTNRLANSARSASRRSQRETNKRAPIPLSSPPAIHTRNERSQDARSTATKIFFARVRGECRQGPREAKSSAIGAFQGGPLRFVPPPRVGDHLNPREVSPNGASLGRLKCSERLRPEEEAASAESVAQLRVDLPHEERGQGNHDRCSTHGCEQRDSP